MAWLLGLADAPRRRSRLAPHAAASRCITGSDSQDAAGGRAPCIGQGQPARQPTTTCLTVDVAGEVTPVRNRAGSPPSLAYLAAESILDSRSGRNRRSRDELGSPEPRRYQPICFKLWPEFIAGPSILYTKGKSACIVVALVYNRLALSLSLSLCFSPRQSNIHFRYLWPSPCKLVDLL